MKKIIKGMFQRIIILIIIIFQIEIAFSQAEKIPFYYKYHVGIEFGPGDNSAPGTSFPFGGGIGGSFRIKNHSFGIRTTTFSDLNIFGSSSYFKYTGPHYGYSFQKKNVCLIPQASVGLLQTNYKHNSEYTGLGFELSVTANVHYRGLGIGVRPMLNINQAETYVGFVFHLLLGWEWNAKPEQEN